MKTVKYFLWARAIKIFLQFLFVLGSLSLAFQLYINLFHDKSYLKLGEWTFGYKEKGYPIQATMSLNIPSDTITYYKNSLNHSYGGQSYHTSLRTDPIEEQLISRFNVHENDQINLRNDIYSMGNVTIRAYSHNKLYNIFWAVTAHMDLIFYLIFIIILIKLTNRYMDEEIFMDRSFKLLSYLGALLILWEILTFIVGFTNGLMMQHPTLNTSSLISEKKYNFLDISIDFFNTVSLTNVGIGILIILLSQVLKEAIKAKQEQELTI